MSWYKRKDSECAASYNKYKIQCNNPYVLGTIFIPSVNALRILSNKRLFTTYNELQEAREDIEGCIRGRMQYTRKCIREEGDVAHQKYVQFLINREQKLHTTLNVILDIVADRVIESVDGDLDLLLQLMVNKGILSNQYLSYPDRHDRFALSEILNDLNVDELKLLL